MSGSTTIPVAPAALAPLLRRLPLLPLRLLMQQVAGSIGRRHPGLFLRLEEHAGKRFLIDPTDLPIVFRLEPRPHRPVLEPRRRNDAGGRNTGDWDARIAGPLAALLAMVHGVYDGDALFFSRDIVIEGDMEAALALRNALDDAEIDLLAEAATALGSAGPVVERLARGIVPPLSRLSGLALTRADRL